MSLRSDYPCPPQIDPLIIHEVFHNRKNPYLDLTDQDNSGYLACNGRSFFVVEQTVPLKPLDEELIRESSVGLDKALIRQKSIEKVHSSFLQFQQMYKLAQEANNDFLLPCSICGITNPEKYFFYRISPEIEQKTNNLSSLILKFKNLADLTVPMVKSLQLASLIIKKINKLRLSGYIHGNIYNSIVVIPKEEDFSKGFDMKLISPEFMQPLYCIEEQLSILQKDLGDPVALALDLISCFSKEIDTIDPSFRQKISNIFNSISKDISELPTRIADLNAQKKHSEENNHLQALITPIIDKIKNFITIIDIFCDQQTLTIRIPSQAFNKQKV
jgi:hypothetical protein